MQYENKNYGEPFLLSPNFFYFLYQVTLNQLNGRGYWNC